MGNSSSSSTATDTTHERSPMLSNIPQKHTGHALGGDACRVVLGASSSSSRSACCEEVVLETAAQKAVLHHIIQVAPLDGWGDVTGMMPGSGLAKQPVHVDGIGGPRLDLEICS